MVNCSSPVFDGETNGRVSKKSPAKNPQFFHSFKLVFENIVTVRFFSLTLSAINSSISSLGGIQFEPFVNLPTLTVGIMTDLSLSGVLAGDIPKSMKFGLSATTELVPKSIFLCVSALALSSGTVFGPITLLKMGLEGPRSGDN